MKTAIIDDEIPCIESLEMHLNELFPKMEIVYKTNNVQKAAEKLNLFDLDLLFLDIEMPGMNGFQLLENFPNRQFDVIFTTAYSEYALQAIKINALNYLLKPIDEDELRETVSKWKKNRNTSQTEQQEKINGLLNHLKKEGFMKSKISVPISDGYEFVKVDNIMYCQGQNNYTKIFLKSSKDILVSKTLKTIENALEQFYFIRIHQSYLINPKYMKKFSRYDGGHIEMEDKKKIPISPKKHDLVIKLFETIKRK